jgi:hypothetical protein
MPTFGPSGHAIPKSLRSGLPSPLAGEGSGMRGPQNKITDHIEAIGFRDRLITLR